MSLQDSGAEIEVVKLSEDGKDIIVRLYDYKGSKHKCNLILGFEATQVWECDMLENVITPYQEEDGKITFELKPYEIKTFRIMR
jgi:alpha-mannosidase